MDMKVVEEELRKGWEATSQLRALMFPSDNSRKQEQIAFDNEKLEAFRENCCSTIAKSFDTCITFFQNVAQSNQTSATHNRLRRDTAFHTSDSHPLRKHGQKLILKPKQPRINTIEIPNLVPDGFAWRKYGQKPILRTKHPREYYRCAHKEDQQCQATKHVQKISDNPTKYRIIYYSQHTCQPDPLRSNDLRMKNVPNFYEKDLGNLISFESQNPTSLTKQVLKPVILDSSSFSVNPNIPTDGMSFKAALPHNNGEGPSMCSTTDGPPDLPLNFIDLTNTAEPSFDNDHIFSLNQMDVMFSPRFLMSPNYMGSSYMEVEDYALMEGGHGDHFFGTSGELQDLPLWDMNDGTASLLQDHLVPGKFPD